MDTKRLDSFLAQNGYCSRRQAPNFLQAHIVTINGSRAVEPGARIDPARDMILINHHPIKSPELVYYLVHKPRGTISTARDEYGRANVTHIVPEKPRVYPVGRLDKETTGLILMTNDGDLALMLTHPKYHIPKTYRVKIKGELSDLKLQALRTGVQLKDGKTARADVQVLSTGTRYTWIEIVLYEGKNRQIRRMCEALKLPLVSLQRIKIGPIGLEDIPPGSYRRLTTRELTALKQLSSQGK